MSELLPGVANQAPVFASNDIVPFRFTPNMQKFVGPVFQEGVLVTGIMAIGRCLTEPEVYFLNLLLIAYVLIGRVVRIGATIVLIR